MLPILFSIGSVHIYSLSVFLVLAWLVFSFLFWRSLRSQGIDEERIFDLTFYGTIAAFVLSRAAYVAVHFELFRESPLKIVAVWVAPGMSLYGALLGGLGILIFLTRRYKVRLGYVLDAFGMTFGCAYIVGLIGAFLDGSYAGLSSSLPWAIRFAGHVGKRHPVEVYEMICMVAIVIVMALLGKKATVHKWPYGFLALWFFTMFSVSSFALEFFKDTPVYLGNLRANQWVLVALFAETMGAFYVRGGGREKGRIVWYNFQAKCSKIFAFILKKKKND